MCESRTEQRVAKLQLRTELFKCVGQFFYMLTELVALLTALTTVLYWFIFN